MSEIKNILLVIMDYIKKSLSLCNLNKKESQGFISTLSTLRFMPYTRITVPFSLGSTIRGVSFNNNLTQDPYGKLCKDIFNGLDNKTILSNLSLTFNKEKHLNAADIVHLKDNTKLMMYPAWAIVMPWEKSSIEKKFEAYPDSFYKNRFSKDLTFESNSRLSIIETMYSSKSLENKVSQMDKLFKSIKRHGLREDPNFPKINILVRANEWRWFMGDAGNHRSYVCSCFDFETLEARVSSIIYKNAVNSWPNVKNGTYSLEEAENIFDSYFNGSNVLRGIV
jgi:hypothetical protein